MSPTNPNNILNYIPEEKSETFEIMSYKLHSLFYFNKMDEFIEKINNNTNIKTLNITAFRDLYDGHTFMDYIHRFVNINTIIISQLYGESVQIGDEGARIISQMDNITTLYLHENNVTEIGLEYICNMKNLKKLHISRNDITNITRKSLDNMKEKLIELDISCNSFTDMERNREIAIELSKISNLRVFNFEGLGDDYEDEEFIDNIMNLEYLIECDSGNTDIIEKVEQNKAKMEALNDKPVEDP